MWLTQIDAINKLWKYSDSTHGFTWIIDMLIVSTDLILYDKEVIVYKIREY